MWGYMEQEKRINSVSMYSLDGSVQKTVDIPSITPLHSAE
jgi:hypothetical protein